MGTKDKTAIADVESAAAPVPKFDFELVITESFPGHTKGEIIIDGAKISELIDSDWSGHFVKKQKDLATEEPAAS
jgi:hypothetical protein